ncbi:hypothetical protein D770_01575 [Flammeovirgaceae bacterium 311]|nr:hypothetical protein D770_01575 [Flammeovirgaceae bacterium 311]
MKKLSILAQPDDSTCGPTSLHAVYNYFKYDLGLDEVIRSVNYLEGGGTLAVFLGLDALSKGFSARMYTSNLTMFDPSWRELPKEELLKKLDAQLKYKKGRKFTLATAAYKQFLLKGGEINMEMLDEALLKSYLSRNIPILAGLSATYLYQTKREYADEQDRSIFDDLRGEPMGHFVVLTKLEGEYLWVADPYKENPISSTNYYKIETNRVINAIHLGILTYDANILIVSPKNLI